MVRKIALFGLFGNGNSGNDGSLEAGLNMLRRVAPDARFTVICAGPEEIERKYAVPAVVLGRGGFPGPAGVVDRLTGGLLHRIAGFVRAVRLLRGCAAFVVPGTGILDDFGEGPGGVPVVLLGWCVAARLCGARVAFVSVGAGPIVNRYSRVLMKAAARLAHFRSYRDQQSKDFMLSIGFDASRDPVYPDLAFSLAPPAEQPAPADDEVPTVGVGLMAYRGWKNRAAHGQDLYDRYVSTMIDFVCWLLARGHPVRLLRGDASDQETFDFVIARVRERSAFAGRMTFAPTETLAGLTDEILATDVVVATRFHTVLCALKACRPTISISYAAKNDVLLDEAGLEDFHQPIEALDGERLKAQFERLLADRARLVPRIGAMGRRAQAELAEQQDLLSATVLPSRDGRVREESFGW